MLNRGSREDPPPYIQVRRCALPPLPLDAVTLSPVVTQAAPELALCQEDSWRISQRRIMTSSGIWL